MNYPFWDVGMGYGWLMAAIAIPHVFVSHFAVGGGLYLVVAETFARKANDAFRLEFLKRLTKFFVLVTLVFGALTGVGIWFIIGLLNPAATEALIHHYVWGWATEWTFFVIEILAAILYLYGWDRMTPKNHMILGWIYFIAAWVSLAIINGILTFMLTPGGWLETGNFWQGFFNETYFSSTVFRTGICLLLAGLFSLTVAAAQPAHERKASLIRYNAIWALLGLIVITPSFYWFFASIPAAIRDTASQIMPFVTARIDQMYWYGLGLAVLVLFGLLVPKRFMTFVGVVAMLLGFIWFGQFEWMREAIRKPYIIYGYMYGNALEIAHADDYKADGLLAHIAYRTGDNGADLYLHTCRSCHTMDGYKALKPWFDGTDEDFIAGIVRGTGVMVGNMPPWMGTEEESRMVAAHIYKEVDQRPFNEVYGLSGVELGHKVFDIRCGVCHQMGGNLDVSGSLTGLEDQDYEDILDAAGEFADEMPDFTGDDVERAALIEYFKTLGTQEGGSNVSAEL